MFGSLKKALVSPKRQQRDPPPPPPPVQVHDPFSGNSFAVAAPSQDSIYTPAQDHRRTFRASQLRRKPTSTSYPYSPNDVVVQPTRSHSISTPAAPKLAPGTFYIDSEMISHVRKQLQLRYALDMQIWNEGRTAKTFRREKLMEKMARSDAILRDTKTLLDAWDSPDLFQNAAYYKTFCEIKKRVNAPGKREWVKNPPWMGVGHSQLDGYGRSGDFVAEQEFEDSSAPWINHVNYNRYK